MCRSNFIVGRLRGFRSAVAPTEPVAAAATADDEADDDEADNADDDDDDRGELTSLSPDGGSLPW